MKKLLILMLVLGLTAAASGIPVSLAPGHSAVVDGNVTWDIVGGVIVATSDTNGIVYDSQIGPANNGSIAPDSSVQNFNSVNGLYDDAGDLGYLSANTSYVGYYDAGSDDGFSSIAPNQEAGDWFQLIVSNYQTSTGLTYMQIDIWSSSNSWAAPVGSLDVVPEPMTIALLGLGGLFLRRRK